MNIWHGCFENNNFGDHVGAYVMEKFIGEKPHFCHDSRKYGVVHVFSGSVLSEAKENWIMYGCGFGEADQTCHEKPLKVFSVRGRLSREMLLAQGIECPEIYFDICEYLPSLFKPKVEKRFNVGYIPHYLDYDESIQQELGSHGLLINICDHPEKIIEQALSCQHIISTSLHGLILADVYGIPREWSKSPNLESDFKFQDYFSRYE